MGGAFPDALVAALCSHNANISNHERSPVVSSAFGLLATMEIAQQVRRLFGPMGARSESQDVLLVENDNSAFSAPAKSEGQESRTVYRKAKAKSRGES